MSICDSKNFWAIPKPARIPPQTPPAGGTEAEAGRIHIPSQMFRPAESALVLLKKSSRKVYNYGTNIKLSDFCPTDSAARSAERYGNTGSPRTARLAKRRFEPKISLAATFFDKRLLSLAILTRVKATFIQFWSGSSQSFCFCSTRAIFSSSDFFSKRSFVFCSR